MAAWTPLPGIAEGDYQIVMKDSSGRISRPFDFKVAQPTQPWAVVSPVIGSLGDVLRLYLVNFPAGKQTVHLHAAGDATFCETSESNILEDLEVNVNRKTDGIAWGSVFIATSANDAKACYGVFTDSSLQKAIFVLGK